VAWDCISKPTRFGGLGVKNLRLLGLALRARWEWLERTDPSRPWQGLNMLQDSASMLFQNFATACIGDGKSILFWRDRWINGLTAEEIAPAATAVVTTRRKNQRRADVALEGNQWLWDVAEGMTPEVRLQCVRLWEAISAVGRNPSEPDRFCWAGMASGQYNTNDTYERLCQGVSSSECTSQSGCPLRR
jgi:hypothetical protein